MLLLAIESSNIICSVALFVESNLVGEYTIYSPNQHDKMLAELTRRILLDFETSPQKLDYVAVSAGPGSFTGLRIGASLAKALCFNSETKLVAVPTIDAFAYSFFEKYNCDNTDVTFCLYSHRDYYYYQIIDQKLEKKSSILFDNLQNIINKSKFICVNKVSKISEIKYKSIDLTAVLIGQYAKILINSGDFVDPINFVPEYIQEFIPKTYKEKE